MTISRQKELNRRDFMSRLGRAAIWATLAPYVIPPSLARIINPTAHYAEVKYYEKLPGKRVHCYLCPYNCILAPGETCPCRTRTNHAGVLLNHSYGNPCIINLDPIEMLPMNHFLPGTKTLALGLAGCNLRCSYCQNWQVSQKRPEQTENVEMSEQKAAASAKQKRVTSISFTYTEPVVFSEYVLAVAKEARKNRIPVVVATSAYVHKKPLLELCRDVTAFSVTLKAFNDDFYQEICGARLKPVLDSLVTIKSQGNWLEVVNLIVPDGNDSPEEIREMSQWLRKNLGADTPLHFLRFVPEYKMRNVPRTPLETLEQARDIALSAGLHHVYISNVAPHIGNNTYCPKCHALLIDRVGYRILKNRMRGSQCPFCGTKLAGIWTRSSA